MRSSGSSFPLLLLGLGLLLAGGLLSSLTGTGTYLPRLLLLAGSAALIWGAARLWPTLAAFSRRMRQVAEPGPSVSWFLAGLVLLVCAVGLGLQHVRLDSTGRKLHSLSAASIKALHQLPRPVELIGVYREGSPEEEMARDALEVYSEADRKVHSVLIDPERQPDLARHYGINFTSGIMVLADSVREITPDVNEEAITQAILRVCDPRRPVVALLDGHGETDANRPGYARLRQLIAGDGFKGRLLRLADYGEVPPEIRVVLILGPTSKLLPGEVRALDRFLDRGGRLGVFLDPGPPTGLETLMSDRGVAVDGRPIADDGPLTSSAGLGRETVAVQALGEHAITHGLTEHIILPGATRAGLRPGPAWAVRATDLLLSARSARLEGTRTDSAAVATRREGDVLPMAAALEWEVSPRREEAASASTISPEKPFARIVVVGDSDFLRDSGIDLFGNRAFANRVLGWLGEREFLLKFPVADRSGTPLRVELRGLRLIFYLVEVLLPLAVLGLGARIWARRR